MCCTVSSAGSFRSFVASSITTIGRDPDLFNQRRRYMMGGRQVDVTGLVSWFAQNATDQEKPVGDRNTLDLYVLGATGPSMSSTARLCLRHGIFAMPSTS
jgi:hypothetical protein